MIHVSQMAELVDDYVIQDLDVGKNQTIIKRQCSTRGTTAPAAFLVADRNGSVVAAGEFMIVGYTLGTHISGSLTVALFQHFQAMQLGCSVLSLVWIAVLCHVVAPGIAVHLYQNTFISKCFYIKMLLYRRIIYFRGFVNTMFEVEIR